MLQENLVETLAASVRENWNRPVYSDWDGATIKYRDLANRIFQLHYVFAEAGVARGDKIALVGRNSLQWGVAYFAAVSYGAVIVPILPDFTAQEIHHIVTHSDAVLLFASDAVYDQLEEKRMRHLKGIFRLEDFSLRYANPRCCGKDQNLQQIVRDAPAGYVERYGERLSPQNFRLDPVPGDSLVTIVYTSGTTGFSKGVMLTAHSLIVNARYYLGQLDLTHNKRMVSFLPLAHSYGCAFDLIAPTLGGCHVTFIGRPPTPKVLLEAFGQIRPTVVLSVPLIIEKIYRNRIKPQLESKALQVMLKLPGARQLILRKMRDKIGAVFGGKFQELVIGGAAFSREAEEFFREIGLPISNGYGMTEFGPLISYARARENRPLGTVGKVIPFLECRIEITDPEHGVGEVLVRGENMMLGYYKDSEATAATIDPDGWLHTGDLGHLDADGYLFLTGRSKNMILTSSGQNVYPEEIEAYLNNMPYVLESLVLDHGGRIVAMVYPDLDRADEDGVEEKQLAELMEQNRQALNERIPKYAAVAKIKLSFEEFEKTPTKKIKRRLYTYLD